MIKHPSSRTLWLALLVCVGVGLFVLVTQVGFLGDDLRFLYDVEHAHGFREIVRYVMQPLGAAFVWRPFTNLFWFIERFVFGTNPVWYHLAHLLLYFCIVWLLYRIVKRIGGAKLAMVTTAIYFITPYHYEGFVWLSSVTDLLALSGSLAAIMLFIRYRDTGKLRMLMWACVAFFLATLSKEFALMTPFIILLIDLLFLRDGRGRGWKPFIVAYGSLFAITALYLVARIAVLGNLSGSNPNTVGSFIDSLKPSYLKMAVNSLTFRFNVAALARVNVPVADFWSRWHGYISVGTTAILFLLALPRFRDKNFWKLVVLAFGIIVLFALPVLPLLGNINENLQHTRFLLAPSAGVALLMAILVTNEGNIARGMRFAKRGFLFCIIAVYAVALLINAKPWIQASGVMSTAINDVAEGYPAIAHATGPILLYVHGLPGSVDGAYAFHDLYSFKEAFDIRFRNSNVTVVPVGRYRSPPEESLCETHDGTVVHLLGWRNDHLELSDETIAGWLLPPSSKMSFGFDSTESFISNHWEARDLMVRQVDNGVELSDFGSNPRIAFVLPEAIPVSDVRKLDVSFDGTAPEDFEFAWKTYDSPEYREFQSFPLTTIPTQSIQLCSYTNWMVGGYVTEIAIKFGNRAQEPVVIKKIAIH
ncbi:MAG: glycosyltransferase family 39 protein [Candidatus Kerfeldbacteria bacterium]